MTMLMKRNSATLEKETIRETCAPTRMRLNKSRPNWSVPNQYVALGGSRELPKPLFSVVKGGDNLSKEGHQQQEEHRSRTDSPKAFVPEQPNEKVQPQAASSSPRGYHEGSTKSILLLLSHTKVPVWVGCSVEAYPGVQPAVA